MINSIILLIFGLFLILGGFMGFKKGSKISLMVGTISGLLVFAGVWMLGTAPRTGWMFLTGLNILLILSFISRLMKTRKLMPSGMLLSITVAVELFCVAHLFLHA